jgi:sulfite exporter TauE/SafE
MEIFLAVFVIGILGSPHCSVMCSSFVPDKSIPFQVGRLTGYTLQWAAVHFFGKLLQESFPGIQSVFRIYSLFLIALVYVFAIQAYRRGSLPTAWMKRLRFPMGKSGIMPAGQISNFSKGAILAFRGCGWLWAFLIATAALEDTGKSFLLLLIFWLSNFPGLLGGRLLFSVLKGSHKVQALALLLMAGLQTGLWMGWFDLPDLISGQEFQSEWVTSRQTLAERSLSQGPLQVFCHKPIAR